MASAPPLIRWGLTISVVVGLIALAFALRLQQNQQQPLLGPSPDEPSDVFCYQGVRTHDPLQPAAQCFAVVDGRFSLVWSGVQPGEAGDETPRNDDESPPTRQGYVIPGLWDGHGHLHHYSEFLHSVDLFGSQSLEEVRSRLKTYVDAHPGAGTKDQWVRGIGWDQTAFGRMPTADDIEQDELLKGVYMMLDRIDVHCVWVSQAVLDLLPDDISDVPGGEIVREPGLGVFCDNAAPIVMDKWPKPSQEARTQMVKNAIAKLHEIGLVGMHDAGNTEQSLEVFSKLAEADELTLRIYAMFECDKRNNYCPHDALKDLNNKEMLSVRSVKLFADGALGSWGSAMLEPYSDHPWTSGSLLINGSDLTQVTKSWAEAGFQVNIHAIGDLANRNAVDALEAALQQQCPDETDLSKCQANHRFRIEHSQIIHPDDQRRIHAMGLIPSIQPTHATSDMKYALSRLGHERLATSAYRMKSMLDVKPILGSDFPVEPPNPFQGIYAAVTRRNPHTGLGAGDSPEGWHTEEALTLDEALWGFTGGAAYGAFMEGLAGVIAPNALADWVVLDESLEEMDVEELREVRVRETWVGGKLVYARED